MKIGDTPLNNCHIEFSNDKIKSIHNQTVRDVSHATMKFSLNLDSINRRKESIEEKTILWLTFVKEIH